MAEAQYETRTRTVQETVVILTLTEDEADELRYIVGRADGTAATVRIYKALERPEAPAPETSADTFEHEGVTYDLAARYLDCDGDVWRFARVGGDVRGEHAPESPIDSDSAELGYVVHMYGPLTKVTA